MAEVGIELRPPSPHHSTATTSSPKEEHAHDTSHEK